MTRTSFLPILLLSGFFLSGCTGNSVYMQSDKHLAQTDPKSIQVYSITDPPEKYEIIGYVSTYSSDANNEGDRLKDNLRKQASQYGANAVIGFKLNMGVSGGGGAQGIAIRYLR
ncbi:MAG: hypothetical protein ABI623_00910 [bacterium]